MITSGGTRSLSFEKACSNPYSKQLLTKSRLLAPKHRPKMQRPTPFFPTPMTVPRILTCTLHWYLPWLHGSPRLRIRPIWQWWHLANLALWRWTLRRGWWSWMKRSLNWPICWEIWCCAGCPRPAVMSLSRQSHHPSFGWPGAQASA